MSPRLISKAVVRPVALASAALILPACGPAPAPARPAPVEARPIAPAPRTAIGPSITLLAGSGDDARAGRDPFAKASAIAPSNESLAKWVEPPLDLGSSYVRSHVVAVGARSAVVRRGAWLYAAHLDRGLQGPIALPQGTFWIGLDEADALYAALPDGTLWRARDLAKAGETSGFVPLVSIPSAVAWDVTAGLLVAAAGNFVVASTDRGRSFRSTALPNDVIAAQIAARPDGTIMVVGHERGDARRPSTWISTDRGATLRPSNFQPRSIHREGARISGQHGSCEGWLTTDGASWTASAPPGSFWEKAVWERMLDRSTTPQGQLVVRAASLTDPPAPEPSGRMIGADGACPAKPSEIFGKNGGGLGALGMGTGGIGGFGASAGVLGLRDSRPPYPEPSRTEWRFLGDGACDGAAAEDRARGSTWCKPKDALTRLPRIAREDRSALRLDVVDLPAGCAPETLEGARGTALLACAASKGTHAVYLAGRDGRWYAEGSVTCDKPPRLFGASDDGTLAFTCARAPSPAPGDTATASPSIEYDLYVRKPDSLGSPGALRAVSVPDAIAYRVLDGGRVVALTTKGKPFSLGLFRGGVLGIGGSGGGGLSLGGIGHGAAGSSGRQGTLGGRGRGTSATGTSGKGTSATGTSGKGTSATGTSTKPASGRPTSATGASARAAPPKDDAAAIRARHTFSVIEDAPDAPRRTLARDLHVADDLTGFATTETEVYFRIEKPAKGFESESDDAAAVKAARYAVLDGGKLRDVPRAKAPSEIRREERGGLLASLSLSFHMPVPGGLAADATHVYWADTDRGLLLRAPRSGGGFEVLARDLKSPWAVAVDDARVYFTALGGAYGEPGSVGFVAKTGGVVTTIAGAELRPIAVAADAGAVYWLSQGLERGATGSLRRAPKDGSPPAVLLGRLASPHAMALSGDRVFVASAFGDVLSVPTSGGAESRVTAAGSPVQSLVATSERLLLVTDDEPAVRSAPLPGGPSTLTAFLSSTSDVVARDGEELWLVSTGGDSIQHLTSGSTRPDRTPFDLQGPSALLPVEAGLLVRERGGARVRLLPRGKGTPTVLYERKDD